MPTVATISRMRQAEYVRLHGGYRVRRSTTTFDTCVMRLKDSRKGRKAAGVNEAGADGRSWKSTRNKSGNCTSCLVHCLSRAVKLIRRAGHDARDFTAIG